MISAFVGCDWLVVGDGIAEVLTKSGVSYEVCVPYKKGEPELQKVNLYIYHHITEQFQKLYGFTSREDRNFFRLLITAKGVGPAVAIKLMNQLTVKEITYAIATASASELTAAKGVGKAAADAIISKLKNKFDADTVPEPIKDVLTKEAITLATNGLMSLGMLKSDIMKKIMSTDFRDNLSQKLTECGVSVTDEEISKIIIKLFMKG